MTFGDPKNLTQKSVALGASRKLHSEVLSFKSQVINCPLPKRLTVLGNRMYCSGRRRWGGVASLSPEECCLVLNGSAMVLGLWKLHSLMSDFVCFEGLLLQLLLLSTLLSLAL